MASKACVIVSTLSLMAGTAVAGLGDVLATLTPSVSGGTFGYDVAIDGDIVIVGDPGRQMAYQFDISDMSSPQEVRYWSPTDVVRSEFGKSVGIYGGVVVAGEGSALEYGVNGLVSFYSASSGELVSGIDSGYISGNFANDIAIFGDRLLIGDPDTSSDSLNKAATGGMWLVDTSDKSYSVLFNPNDASGDQAGEAVDLNSGYCLLGADQQYYSGPNHYAGAVQVYSADGVWEREITAPSSDQDAGDHFGCSVAISKDSNIAIIGAKGEGDLGAAYLFDVSDGTYLDKLLGEDDVNAGKFGSSVAISGNYAVVGDPTWHRVFIYNISDPTNAVQVAKIDHQSAAVHQLGRSLAVSGPFVVAGGGNKAIVIDLRCNEADFAAPYGDINYFDYPAFLAAFNAGDPDADLNGDGIFSYFDVNIWVMAYNSGCP